MSRRSVRSMRRQLQKKTGMTPDALAYFAAASQLSDADLLAERDRLLAELRAQPGSTEEYVLEVRASAHTWGAQLSDDELMAELDKARDEMAEVNAAVINAAAIQRGGQHGTRRT